MVEGVHHWAVFIGAGLLLNITPGADMALVASRAASGGWRAGAAAALGVGAGCGVHIASAALGVSALLYSSPWAFALLRWVGAAYLVWLGWGLLRSRLAPGAGALPPAGASDAEPTSAATSVSAPATAVPLAWRQVFVPGGLTNALIPKVALFFLAFVPQFIAPAAPNKAWAFVALGVVFVVNGTLVNLAIAGLVAGLRQRLAGQGRLARAGQWLNRGVGALFVAMGLKLALDSPAP